MRLLKSVVLRRSASVAALAAAALVGAAPAVAGSFQSDPKPLTTPAAGGSDQFFEVVGTSGGFVMAWNRAAGSANGVYIQRFKPGGAPIGSPTPVDLKDPDEFGVEGLPELVDLGGNKVGVVWKASGPTLKGAVYDVATGKLGKPVTYLTGNSAASFIHDLAMMKNGRVALVTRSFATGGEDTTLFILDATMKQVGPSRIVEDDISGPFGLASFEQTVVAHGAGGVAIYRAADYQLKATPFDGSGKLGTPFQINTTPMGYLYGQTFRQFTVKAERLPNGGYVVAWPIYDPGQYLHLNLHARVYDKNGKAVGRDFIVPQNVSGSQWEPQIVVFAKGFGVGWHNTSIVAGKTSQPMRFFDLTGAPLSDDMVPEYYGSDTSSGIVLPSEQTEYARLADGSFVKVFAANNRIYGHGLPLPTVATPGADKIGGTAQDEIILAREEADVVKAGHGDDLIDGGVGPDVIEAGPGDDTIVPGGGDDVLTGGGGADVFVFRPKGGKDQILDFEAVDRIDVSAFHYRGTGDVVSAAQQVGKDVVITLADQTDAAAVKTIVRLKNYKRENFKDANVIQ